MLLWAWRRGLLWLAVMDLCAVPLAVGYGIGRIGCQLSGDGDYGKPWDGPWAMAYPHGTVPTDVTVHPTPIYETLAMGVLGLLLWRVRDQVRPGALFALLPRRRGPRAPARRVHPPQRPCAPGAHRSAARITRDARRRPGVAGHPAQPGRGGEHSSSTRGHRLIAELACPQRAMGLKRSRAVLAGGTMASVLGAAIGAALVVGAILGLVVPSPAGRGAPARRSRRSSCPRAARAWRSAPSRGRAPSASPRCRAPPAGAGRARTPARRPAAARAAGPDAAHRQPRRRRAARRRPSPSGGRLAGARRAHRGPGARGRRRRPAREPDGGRCRAGCRRHRDRSRRPGERRPPAATENRLDHRSTRLWPAVRGAPALDCATVRR